MTRTVAYLGPQGSFTHQAALQWAQSHGDSMLIAKASVDDVVAAVDSGHSGYGVVAVENTVEGYVVPTLDALVDWPGVAAIDETTLDISFDALVRPDHRELREVTAHPHGLAQCRGFTAAAGLRGVPASSNAAACRDLGVHQVALGPSICGPLYGLVTHERAVADFTGARTRFLTIAMRTNAHSELRRQGDVARRTMLAITPTSTGPGVLARITSAFGGQGVNLSSLITRPLKAAAGAYVFIVTVDAAPWSPPMNQVLRELMAAGDRIKALGVMPVRSELDDVVHHDVQASHVPVGSVGGHDSGALRQAALLWR